MSQRTDSTTGMSPERFAAILKREAATTPGHWGTYYDPQGTYSVEAQPRLIPGSGSTSEGLVATIRVEDSDAEQAYSNARFIAHAREDVPALLAEVERLREQLAAVDREIDDLVDSAKDDPETPAVALYIIELLRQARGAEPAPDVDDLAALRQHLIGGAR